MFWVIEQFLTNSTVTTTVLQQASGAVFLGLPVTDWITAGAGVVVALFAYVTVREARRNRRKDMIEKMLEKLYNPMFEMLDTAKLVEITADTAAAYGGPPAGKYRWLGVSEDLKSILLNYGHYLGATEHDKTRELLSTQFLPQAPEADHTECLAFIKEKREQLTAELKGLS